MPRLPPSFLIEGITLLLRWLPVIPYNNKIANHFDRFRRYRHFGDMRYLTAATRVAPEQENSPATYPGLNVIANPPQLSRWFWLGRRLFATLFKAGISDHDINIYIEKLAYWGIKQNSAETNEGRRKIILGNTNT